MPAAVAAPTTAVVEKWKESPDARIFGGLHWAHWWTFASLRLVVNRDTPKSGPKINVFYINFRSSDIQSFYNFIEGNPMDCALIDVIFKGTQVSWLLKKVMRGLIFGLDFGVSRLAGGAGYCCLFLTPLVCKLRMAWGLPFASRFTLHHPASRCFWSMA
jgi:hypothetical protein